MELRPYQTAAIQAINGEWREGRKHTLLVLPTGCGKTVVFNTLAKDKATDGNVLILAHRSELLDQASDKYDGDTGYIKAERNTFKPVSVGSIQTLSRRTESYPHDLWKYIIVDEAHHSTADSYQKFLQWFPDAYVLGATATPDNSGKKALATYYDSIAFEYPIRQAVEEGYLCRPTARTVPLNIDLSNVTIKAGDFEVNSICETLEPYLPQIAEMIKEYAADRKTVVFMPLVHIAQEFRDILTDAGVNCREVNGESADRAETLEWFHNAEKGSVLINSLLLTEGWDEPSADCIVMLRPTKIRGFYAQCVGRILRPFPGKKNALILDFLWLSTRHDLCRPADLVATNKEEKEYIRKSTEKQQIDLFDACTDAEEARRNALAEALRAQKRKKAKLIDPLQYFVSINQIDMEDYEPSFAWEIQPATTKQMQMLENWGINPDGMNKGRASMIIDKLLTRRAQGMATPKQIRLLERQGYDNVGEWTFDRASKKIGQLASVGWQRWRLHD